MSLFRSLGKGLAAVASPFLSAGRTINKIPGANLVPGLGLLGGAATIAGAINPSRGKTPQAYGGLGLPSLPGVSPSAPPPGTTGGFGFPRGPGGGIQAPWNDPSIPDWLQQFAIDDEYLSTVVRAPRGYVVLRDQDGQPYGVLREVARKMGLWKPAKKPPISVGDWNALMGAQRTINKLKKVEKAAKKVSSYGCSTGRRRVTLSRTVTPKRITRKVV